MKHISLGGLDVSRIGLGTMAMSGYYLDPTSSDGESIRTIQRALEHRVRAEAAGQLADPFDRLVAALADDVGGAELSSEGGAVGVVAEQDDLFGAESLRCDHAAEADGAVADDRDRVPGRDLGRDGGVVAGTHHVGQGQ